MADPDPPEVPEVPEAPGGTPTPEPGPTPTPQEPELKSAAQLLGTEDPQEPKPEPAAPPKPEAKQKSEVERRIQAISAEKWEEKRGREAAEARAQLAEQTLAELARLDPNVAATLGREPTAPAGDPARPAARTYTQAEVLALAQQTAANTVFNQQVDAAVLAGRAAHNDYDASIAELRKLTGPEMPVTFVQAALETGELTEIVYSLGKNPSEADRILSLPPLKQAVALARYADELRGARKTPEPSRAPEAIAPKVTGRAMTEMELDDPKLPLQEFIRRRNEIERKARQRA